MRDCHIMHVMCYGRIHYCVYRFYPSPYTYTKTQTSKTPKGCVVIEDVHKEAQAAPATGAWYGKHEATTTTTTTTKIICKFFSILQRKFFKSICVLLCYMIHIITHTNTFLNRFMLHHIYIYITFLDRMWVFLCVYFYFMYR